MTDLSEAIERGWAAAGPGDPGQAVSYFRDLLERYPGHLRALFCYASALDAAGREAEAAPAYEQALAARLDGDELRQGLVQYGSTLRNLGRSDDAVAVLRRAGAGFPGSPSVQVFLALALTSAGDCQEAVRTLITLALDYIASEDLQHYQRALRRYAGALTSPGS